MEINESRPDARVLYRATERDGDLGPLTCWAESRADAERYQEEGTGHGGDTLYRARLPYEPRTLDVADAGHGAAGIRAIAEALGVDASEALARGIDLVHDYLEQGGIAGLLQTAGYDWIRYEDSYPEGCVTWLRISVRAIRVSEVTA